MAPRSIATVSRTRVRILRQLAERDWTVSELARELGLGKSTLHKSLELLVRDGLVVRKESEERIWVYYALTPAGREFMAQGRLVFVLDLSAIFSVIGAVLAALAYVLVKPTSSPPVDAPIGKPGGAPIPSDASAVPLPFLTIALGLLALAATLAVLRALYVRKLGRLTVS